MSYAALSSLYSRGFFVLAHFAVLALAAIRRARMQANFAWPEWVVPLKHLLWERPHNRAYENNDVMGTRRFFKHKNLKTSSHYFHRKSCRIGVWQNQDAAFVLRYDFRKPPSRENMVISPSSSCGKGCIITPPIPE